MEVRQFTRGRRELRTSPGEVVDDADSGVSPMTDWSNWDGETEDVYRMSNCTPVYGQTSNYPYGQDWRGNWTPKSSRSASPARSGWNPNWFKSSRHDPWENYAWDDWYAPAKGLQLEQVQPSEVCPGNDSGVCHGDQKKGRGDDQLLSPTSPNALVQDQQNKPSGQIPSDVPSIAGAAGASARGTGATVPIEAATARCSDRCLPYEEW